MTSKILASADILSSSYMPEKLTFRDNEKSRLQSAITTHVHTFVYGEVGIGKSALVKSATSDFKGKSIYVDCSLYQTTNAVFREILSSLSSLVFSRSNYDLLKRLREKTKNNKNLVCLDHIDYLKETEVVSKLIGLGFLVLLVADREETYLRLDPLTRTNFTNVVRIPTYTYDQALAILSERAKLSLREWSYGEAVVKKIAQQCKGNIALGLNTLKTAAHNAESENRVKIEENDVPNIDCPEFELNQDEKVLLKILQEWKSLPSSRLYAFYREKAKYPKEERSFRNYVRNLASKGLVRAIGEKSGRMYEVTDQGDMDPKSDA